MKFVFLELFGTIFGLDYYCFQNKASADFILIKHWQEDLVYLEGMLPGGTFPLPRARHFGRQNTHMGGHFISFHFSLDTRWITCHILMEKKFYQCIR
jgi:hypothetical protein